MRLKSGPGSEDVWELRSVIVCQQQNGPYPDPSGTDDLYRQEMCLRQLPSDMRMLAMLSSM